MMAGAGGMMANSAAAAMMVGAGGMNPMAAQQAAVMQQRMLLMQQAAVMQRQMLMQQMLMKKQLDAAKAQLSQTQEQLQAVQAAKEAEEARKRAAEEEAAAREKVGERAGGQGAAREAGLAGGQLAQRWGPGCSSLGRRSHCSALDKQLWGPVAVQAAGWRGRCLAGGQRHASLLTHRPWTWPQEYAYGYGSYSRGPAGGMGERAAGYGGSEMGGAGYGTGAGGGYGQVGNGGWDGWVLGRGCLPGMCCRSCLIGMAY